LGQFVCRSKKERHVAMTIAAAIKLKTIRELDGWG
jgi:hypothetical protein